MIQPTVARFGRQAADYGPMLEQTAAMMQALRDEIKAEVLADVRSEIAELRGALGIAQQIGQAVANIGKPIVNVAPPTVHVAAPNVSVEAPEVAVNVPQHTSDVKLLPAPPGGQKSIQIQRDERGAIIGALVKEM